MARLHLKVEQFRSTRLLSITCPSRTAQSIECPTVLVAEVNRERKKTMNALVRQKRQKFPYGDVWDKPYIYLDVAFCNAKRHTTFSKEVYLELDVLSETLQDGLFAGHALFDIFQGISTLLMRANGDVESITDAKQKIAIKRLVDYTLENDGKHVECLKKLESTKKADEATIQTVLACHLFAPLLSEGKVVVDRVYYKKDTNESSEGNRNPQTSVRSSYAQCPFCKQNVTTDNTNFGCIDLWHGRADIVIKGDSMQEIVAVAVDRDDNGEDGDDEEGQGEHAPKRMKLEEEKEGTWYSIAEVKAEIEDGAVSADLRETKSYMQAISQTILNSFLAVKLNKELENRLIPSFYVSAKYIYINFYNVEKDTLLVQDRPIRIFDESGINYWAILSVWMALNFDKFPSKFDVDPTKRSGFQSWLQRFGVLEKYKNEVTSGFASAKKREHTKSNSVVNPMRTAELFQQMIQDDSSSN